MRKYLVNIAMVVSIAFTGCQERGPAAKAGERADEVIDNVKHGEPPLKEKGTMEKMGEAIDETINKKEDK